MAAWKAARTAGPLVPRLVGLRVLTRAGTKVAWTAARLADPSVWRWAASTAAKLVASRELTKAACWVGSWADRSEHQSVAHWAAPRAVLKGALSVCSSVEPRVARTANLRAALSAGN